MRFAATFFAALLPIFIPSVYSQGPLQSQTNTWNSDFQLSDEQIASLGLDGTQASNLNVAVQFERTNWADGSVRGDPFYTQLPNNAKTAPAGTVLKVESYTNPGNYTIAPALAISRIIYQSKTLNGSLVPVSAYILWPFANRYGGSRAPLVSWGHGTSGIFAECAPSHIRNLWDQFSAPFTLALAGFAVVATDYAGLGVPFYPDGKPINHQFAASPAAGNDMLYAAQAARADFPSKLTNEFAVMGHSQGGGAAWAAAQQQVKAKIPGYVGAVSIAPVTSSVDLARALQSSLGLLQIAKALPDNIPSVKMTDMLTTTGIATFKLLEEIQGCNSATKTLVTDLLISGAALTKDAFMQSSAADKWNELTTAGGKEFKGPMLVIQGANDETVSADLTTSYVQKTCNKWSKNGLHYLTVDEVGHVPVLYASQQYWIAWLDRRFGKSWAAWFDKFNSGKCSSETIGNKTPMPVEQYTRDLNYYFMYALQWYSLA